MRGLLECNGNLFVPIDSICCHPVMTQVDKIEESRVDWQEVVNAIPCLLWGVLIVVVILVAMYIIMKYHCLPKMKNEHELKMKEQAFIYEWMWTAYGKLKESTDDSLKQKVENLNHENSKLKEALSFEEKKVELMDKQIQRYEKIWKNINLEIKSKDNK